MTENSRIPKNKKNFRLQKKHIIPLLVFLASLAVHITTRFSVKLSNFMNFGISNFLRGMLAKITSIIPFSIGETALIIIPVIMLVIIGAVLFNLYSETVFQKITYRLLVLIIALYALFAFSFAPAYGTSKADVLFNFNSESLGKEELKEASYILVDRINTLADGINFRYGSFSEMGYDLDELSKKLIKAYDSLEEKYPFINNFTSRLKPIALSEPMTYTHISGVYSYYTGETNININFPDYTLPFTSAHEMAHQRGFARENEANFVAFLTCMESDNEYIKYSGYLNIFEYITNSLYLISPQDYYELYYALDVKVRAEMAAYGSFFEKYRDSTASKVSGTINDNYLKSQGVEGGEKSYAMVTDLAASYILQNFEKEVFD